MIKNWEREFKKLSENFTTNGVMPIFITEKLLTENEELKEKLSLEEITFPKLPGLAGDIKGLEIIAGLQNRKKGGYLTLFRAIRVPTYKRIYDLVSGHGYNMLNYEQERILEFYKNKDYVNKKNKIKKDARFWTQPQERVVNGLPLFALANDALQVHRAFRSQTDTVAMIIVHIPKKLLKTGKIKLISNAAIDLDYENSERDVSIKDFREKNGYLEIDYAALRARGVDLHELYSKDLPKLLKGSKKLGIEQEFFLLNVYKIKNWQKINSLLTKTDELKKNEYFMHGFFGDQNVFGRRPTEFLPNKCQAIKLNKK